MQTEIIKIHKGEWLTDALKRQGYRNIPSNVILDKTLTGLGVESTSKCNYSHKNEIHPKIVIIKRKINKDLQTLK